MQEIAQLLVLLVAYYATFGIMAVGFAMMLGGDRAAGSTARFFFLSPVQRLVQRTWATIVAAVVAMWTGFVTAIARWIAAELKELAADLRWLATRPRGWMRRR